MYVWEYIKQLFGTNYTKCMHQEESFFLTLFFLKYFPQNRSTKLRACVAMRPIETFGNHVSGLGDVIFYGSNLRNILLRTSAEQNDRDLSKHHCTRQSELLG